MMPSGVWTTEAGVGGPITIDTLCGGLKLPLPRLFGPAPDRHKMAVPLKTIRRPSICASAVIAPAPSPVMAKAIDGSNWIPVRAIYGNDGHNSVGFSALTIHSRPPITSMRLQLGVMKLPSALPVV